MGKIIINEQGEEFVELNGIQVKLKRVKQMPLYNSKELIEYGESLFFERINEGIEELKNNDKNHFK